MRTQSQQSKCSDDQFIGLQMNMIATILERLRWKLELKKQTVNKLRTENHFAVMRFIGGSTKH